jgi:hypothetical protein
MALCPVVASAATMAFPGPPTALGASFSPKHLGAATTITFAVNIDPPTTDAPPPPLTQIDFSYPSNLGFATSGLGLAECNPVRLQELGPQACPPNSKMGNGSATVEVPFGTDLVNEQVSLSLFAGPSSDGFVHLLVLASGKEPVEARILITAVLLPGHLQITVPPIGALPGAPKVSISQIRASLGGPLTYYERTHGHTLAYHPRGIGLPDSCPRGGWRIGTSLSFEDDQHSAARTAISCPRRQR